VNKQSPGLRRETSSPASLPRSRVRGRGRRHLRTSGRGRRHRKRQLLFSNAFLTETLAWRVQPANRGQSPAEPRPEPRPRSISPECHKRSGVSIRKHKNGSSANPPLLKWHDGKQSNQFALQPVHIATVMHRGGRNSQFLATRPGSRFGYHRCLGTVRARSTTDRVNLVTAAFVFAPAKEGYLRMRAEFAGTVSSSFFCDEAGYRPKRSQPQLWLSTDPCPNGYLQSHKRTG
jgi:hypothetical protein